SRFDVSEGFRSILYYHQGLEGMREYLNKKGEFDRIVFFFSLPPKVYASTAKELVDEGFGAESSIIIEKPFGHDYESAVALNKEITQYFSEHQIYRIDHYLGKETVQNILVFRFANSLFEPIWNSRYIESIQISAFETIGTEGRAQYFDSSGIIRDMAQNHLMQLLCLVTMEPPITLAADDIRSAKVNVLRTLTIEDCHRWQYEGYRNEEGVAPDSETETYAELKMRINNYRWNRVPIYLRTGKYMPRKGTEIGIQFRTLPQLLFNEAGALPANNIIIRIQPNEGIFVDMLNKVPGTDQTLQQTSMKYTYRDAFDEEIPEAYQRLLLDVLRGDQTLFVSGEETEESWKLFNGFLDQGEVSIYRRGKVPTSRFAVNWIDFEEY
ncbi:MAG: glucose-6-phosphate dehydrogenase, partial [Bdellovibrionales bacterium]|nr:glucose-6-phosphate dehydrogenase [Bdellovibrionales bacterium]